MIARMTTMSAITGNILIVEDDGQTRDLLATLLATQGFYAVSAEDGLEALHLLRTVRRRAPDVPCLVLLDLTMPRLDGVEKAIFNIETAVTRLDRLVSGMVESVPDFITRRVRARAATADEELAE